MERSRSAALGILYAEDFDVDEPAAAPPPAASAFAAGPFPPGPFPPGPFSPGPFPSTPPSPPAAPPPPPLTQADVNAACLRAVQAAQAAWADGAQERRTVALEAVAAGLAEARAEAARHAEALADGIARTVLSVLSAILPQLCQAHGDAEVRAVLRTLLPSVGRSGPVVVRVHAGLIDALRDDVDLLDEAVAGAVELRAANLPPGDARVSWENGGLVRDGAAIRAAIKDSLSVLGLLEPLSLASSSAVPTAPASPVPSAALSAAPSAAPSAPATPVRSLAYAQ